jgi:hypothetical protein
MSVNAEWSCAFHGDFEARVQAGVTPHCPCGCSPEFVERVFITPPAIATERVRNASRIVKDAIDSMGLTDLDINPSTPGNSPAEKNLLKNKSSIKAEVWDQSRLKDVLSSFPAGENYITKSPADGGAGLGNPYRKDEWQQDRKTGKLTHSPLSTRARAQFVKVKE